METLPREQLDEFKATLQARRASLLDDIREELKRADESSYAELAGRVHDAGDESVADLLVDLEVAITHRHIEELREIEEAVRRIREGGYGFCDSCGEAIALPRLESMPAAIRCVACQARFEKASSEPAGHSL